METEKQSVSSSQQQRQQWQQVELPSKFDIIPIHNSDRASFKRCREYWNWNSPTKQNLMVRADTLGINIPMWFGTGIHYALEQYYSPDLRRSPVEAFKTWFDIQWEGGVVTEDWLDKVYDLEPQTEKSPAFKVSDDVTVDQGWALPTYKVRGLNDILPDPDTTEFDELRHMGIEMMMFYEKYAAVNDDFEVVTAEHNFSVPIWDYENDCILRMIDTREDSPNYGKELEVHARGRMDAIYRKPNGKLGIIDHKTAGKIDEDLPIKLETDEQVTSYLWAAEVEASYYDLPHKGEPLEEVIFNVLRKAYPKPPTELKTGMFSVNRAEESTTYDMLMEWANKNMPGVPFNEKQQAYADYLREVGDEQFIIRKLVRRNRHQLTNIGQRIYLEAMDMLAPDLRIYPNLRNDFMCLGCAFRAPCLAKQDGSDYKQLIRDNYVTNRDR
jgi:PD-(D/E)XK nuclease superfamily